MLTQGQEYVERSIEDFESRSLKRQLKKLQRQARRHGLNLVPLESAV
jgi:hypothetical protein